MTHRAFLYLFAISILHPSLVFGGRTICVKSKEAVAQTATKPNRNINSENTVKYSKYTPLTWTGKREGAWYEVQSMDQKNSWLHRKDFSFSDSCVLVRVEKSRLRKGPGPEFPKAGMAQRGDAFKALGGEDGWTRVQDAEGMVSWINLDHISRPESRFRMSFDPRK